MVHALKGTYHERSDIDLVAFGEQVNSGVIAKILMDLDDSDIPYLVDLLSYGELKNVKLIDHINRVSFVVFEKNTNMLNSLG